MRWRDGSIVTTTEDPLTTGWEAATPDGDTMLRRFLLHNADLCVAFSAAGGWLWSAWPTPDLRARGWHLSGHPPVLIRPPAALFAPPEVDLASVHRVDTLPALAVWERVAATGYPLPDVDRRQPGELTPAPVLHDDRISFLTSTDGREPVAAAASFRSRGISSLAFGATLPSARGRGHWRRLAVARLLAQPHDWFTGVFSDLSRASAERLGFIPIQRLTLWTFDRPPPAPSQQQETS